MTPDEHLRKLHRSDEHLSEVQAQLLEELVGSLANYLHCTVQIADKGAHSKATVGEFKISQSYSRGHIIDSMRAFVVIEDAKGPQS